MRPFLLLPMLLAACSAPPPADTPRAQCEQAANSDPAVRANLGKEAGNLDYAWQNGPEIQQAKLDAVTRCLRARGLAPRGGVERAK